VLALQLRCGITPDTYTSSTLSYQTKATIRSTGDEYEIERLGPFDADRWLLPKPVNCLDVLTCQAVEFLD
jgi:hypothetical protein